MTVIQLLRDATARRAAIFDLARMHDRFSELEHVYIAAGEMDRNRPGTSSALPAVAMIRPIRRAPIVRPRCGRSSGKRGRRVGSHDHL